MSLFTVFHRILAAGLIAAATGASALAEGLFGANAPPPYAVSLHSGWSEPDGRRIAGVRVALEPGWKTYWRSPGPSGMPPQFDWTGSKNLKSVTVVWPAPIVFETYGTQAIGYKNQMVLPLAITPEDPAKPIRLRLALFYGVCEEVCIPARSDLALDIAPGDRRDAAELIAAALASAPQDAARHGLDSVACAIEGADAERAFEARISFQPPLPSAPVVVAEGPNGVTFSPLATRLENGALVASGALYAAAGGWIDRSAIRLTLLHNGRGVEIDGCAAG